MWRRLGAGSIVLVLVAGACGGSSGPSVSELESKRDLAALVEVAGSGGFDEQPAQAIEALRRLNDPQTVALLRESLGTERWPSGEFAPAGEVIEVLGGIGGPEAAAVILDYVRGLDPNDPAGYGSPETQITWALTAIGPDAYESLAPLVEAPIPAETDPGLAVDTTLRQIATDVFAGRAAESPDPFNREEAIASPVSTGPLGSDRAEQALLAALRVAPRCTVGTSLTYSCTGWAEQAGTALVRRRRDDITPLLTLLDDPATASIYYGLVLLGAPGTEGALVSALDRNPPGTPLGDSMLAAYANSGNATLEDAAHASASAHGYTIQPGLCPSIVGSCEDVSLWGSIDDPPDGT